MSESDIKNNNNMINDEIDIFEFCSRMWNAFVKFAGGVKDFIVSVVIFLIRKSVWIISFALIGALIGFLWRGNPQPCYSSSLEFTTGGVYDEVKKKYVGGIDNALVINHINILNNLTHKPELLADYLKMEKEDVGKIREIKACYGIDINKDMKPDFVDLNGIYNPKDTMQARVPSHVYVSVSVYDESILAPLRNGLLQYIGSNAYIRELFDISKKQTRQLIRKIDSEIDKIDSLQRASAGEKLQPDKWQLLLIGEPKKQLACKDVLELYARKQLLEKGLEISSEIVTIVRDFTPLRQDESPDRQYILMFGKIMAVIGLFTSVIWQYRKKIWSLIRENER